MPPGLFGLYFHPNRCGLTVSLQSPVPDPKDNVQATVYWGDEDVYPLLVEILGLAPFHRIE